MESQTWTLTRCSWVSILTQSHISTHTDDDLDDPDDPDDHDDADDPDDPDDYDDCDDHDGILW